MKTYYAMVTPGHCHDYGNVILVDSRIGDFLEEAINCYDDDEMNDFKARFTAKTWLFVKEQLNALHTDDEQFVNNIADNWQSKMSDNYYQFLELNSTIEFNSITKLIKYVQENDIKMIGDLK